MYPYIGISCTVDYNRCPKVQDYQTMIETFFKQVIESKEKMKNISYLKLHMNMDYKIIDITDERYDYNKQYKRLPFIWNIWKCMELVRLMIQSLHKTSINCLDLHAIKFSRPAIEYLKFWFREPFGDVYIKPIPKTAYIPPWKKLVALIPMHHVILTQYQQHEQH